MIICVLEVEVTLLYNQSQKGSIKFGLDKVFDFVLVWVKEKMKRK